MDSHISGTLSDPKQNFDVGMFRIIRKHVWSLKPSKLNMLIWLRTYFGFQDWKRKISP